MKRRSFLVLLVCSLMVASTWLALSKAPAQTRETAWKPQLVILVACDTLRADRLHCYGNQRPLSPNIDHLAREGVLFERAFSQSNHTQPSFQSILTGLYPPERDDVLPPGPPTIASLLSAYGIDTAGFTGGGHISKHFGVNRGFTIYRDDAFRWLHWSEKQAFPWLAEHARSGRRGFLFVHGYDTHTMYAKPLHFSYLFDPDYRGPGTQLTYEMHTGFVEGRTYQKPVADIEEVPSGEAARAPVALTDRDLERLRASYDGCVTYADLHVGLLMSKLYELGLADKTLVIFMSDHGEQLLEGPRWGHGLGWASTELHVPLILWAPKAFPPRRVTQVVEMTSLFPTILAAFDVPAPGALCATSLVPLATGQQEDDANADAFSGRSPKRALRTRDWCLVETTDPERESRGTGLFDLNADPLQLHDLSGDPSKQTVLADLRARTATRLRRPHL